MNLIAPATLYAPRRNNLDFRVAKILRYGRTRTQVGVDVYNATNTDIADDLQPGVYGPHGRVADADGDSAGAIRQDQRAVRLLAGSGSGLQAPGFWQGGRVGSPKGGPALFSWAVQFFG